MMSTFAFAAEQTENMGSGQGSITVKNPMKHDTYTLYKIFNAKLGSNDTSISYTKIDDIDYDDIVGDTGKIFKEKAKNIYYAGTSTSGELTATDVAGLTAFVQKTGNAKLKVGNTITSNGESTLKFTGLSYGYYVVVATRGTDSVISVDSTNKNAEIINKNDGTPDLSGSKKAFASKEDAEANNKSKITDVYAGQKVWYRAEIGTGNYVTSGGAVKTVLEYTIEDTLPSFLKNVNVESITIDGADYKVGGATPQFNNNKIIIPWVNNETAKTPLYKDGAKIVIIYSADIDASGLNYSEDGNKNVITPSYRYDGGTGGGSSDKIIDTVYSYALAIKKINDQAQALTGAKFTIKGYTLSAATVENETNVYTVTGKDENATGEFEVGTNGQVIIKGVNKDAVEITETEAPEGYNKLTAPETITPSKVSSTATTTTVYLDEKGKVTSTETNIYTTITSGDTPATFKPIINKKGSLLPETGGIGTTIFYLIGAILVIGAGVVFVTRRRMHSDK